MKFLRTKLSGSQDLCVTQTLGFMQAGGKLSHQTWETWAKTRGSRPIRGQRTGNQACTDLEAWSLCWGVACCPHRPGSPAQLHLCPALHSRRLFPFELHHPRSLALWVPVGCDQQGALADGTREEGEVGVPLPALAQLQHLGSGGAALLQDHVLPLIHRQQHCLFPPPPKPVPGTPPGWCWFWVLHCPV